MDERLDEWPSGTMVSLGQIFTHTGKWSPAERMDKQNREDEHFADSNKVWDAISPIHDGDVCRRLKDIMTVEPRKDGPLEELKSNDGFKDEKFIHDVMAVKLFLKPFIHLDHRHDANSSLDRIEDVDDRDSCRVFLARATEGCDDDPSCDCGDYAAW